MGEARGGVVMAAARPARPAPRRHRHRRPVGARRRLGAAGVVAMLAAGTGAVVAAHEASGRGPEPRAASRARPAAMRDAPRPPLVPQAASGRYQVVAGTAEPPAGTRGRTVRYMVEVERGLPFGGPEFAGRVHGVLNDPRGWGRGGVMRFRRVERGAARFRVSLSSPALTDRMCRPLTTRGELSCHQGARSVINARRWAGGAPTYGADLAGYREYVVNHEVGHALGHGHRGCPRPGRRAPVMVQQTISLRGCRPNPWPFPGG
ncbi:DUF3152 domain-containing protein [Spirillospora sp. CA-294931]|uniref:DUF3152 domain-containing protein n=1 Tax=Spirillospora sp. CA-294931 TaxID=3240042 RepID=UPI003D8C15A0